MYLNEIIAIRIDIKLAKKWQQQGVFVGGKTENDTEYRKASYSVSLRDMCGLILKDKGAGIEAAFMVEKHTIDHLNDELKGIEEYYFLEYEGIRFRYSFEVL